MDQLRGELIASERYRIKSNETECVRLSKGEGGAVGLFSETNLRYSSFGVSDGKYDKLGTRGKDSAEKMKGGSREKIYILREQRSGELCLPRESSGSSSFLAPKHLLPHRVLR